MTESLAFAFCLLDRLQKRALRATDEEWRVRYIDAADVIIADLMHCGVLSGGEADKLSRSWIEDYAIARASAEGNIDAIWQRKGFAAFLSPDTRRALLRKASNALNDDRSEGPEERYWRGYEPSFYSSR